MGKTTIEWANFTFNPWRGCTKISAGCTHCYADVMSNPAVLGVWGPRGARVVAAESYWKQPLAWDRAARLAGERRRVFCASLADVFEGPETMPADAWQTVQQARGRLWATIEATEWLDWLLLTKRPEHALQLATAWSGGRWPSNAWIGTSVENQAAADERIPHLLQVPAHVRFLSCEPLLGPVDLSEWLDAGYESNGPRGWVAEPSGLHWLIVGGESGPHARPMHPAWARSLRDQCQAAGVTFFFKQWGEWHPDCLCDTRRPHAETPRPQPGGIGVMFRCGKLAGRLLDGALWDEVPR